MKAKYNAPIILLGDFNSRVGSQSDFEIDCEHEGSLLDEDQSYLYFQTHGLLDRAIKIYKWIITVKNSLNYVKCRI